MKKNAEVNLKNGENYQTLKSTFIMSGSSVVNIVLGIIRHKIIALLLSTEGLGLLGVFQSIANLAGMVTGLGINESGARQVAVAFHAKNNVLISRTVLSLRRMAFFTGICGTILLFLLSKRVSIITFDNPGQALNIALLSISVLLGAVSGGQLALIQGTRNISDLAKVNMLGPFSGTLLSLPVIYFLGMRGIVSYLVILSATTILTSWWYSKKIEIPEVKATWRNSFVDAKPLLSLGAAFMIGNILGASTPYLLRIILIRFLGLDAVGEFQAATILSVAYVAILFKAMATDFYPRLSAASGNSLEVGLLVNEQVEAGLLLALPGVLLTLTLAPLVLVVFYSAKFLPAVDVLRWQALGILLQVISWPLGYLLRAKAAGGLFIVTELFNNISYLALAWIGIRSIGLSGIGIAFFLYNALYLVLIYSVAQSKYKIAFSSKTKRIIGFAAGMTIVAFLCAIIIPNYRIPVGLTLTVLAGIYSYKKLNFSQWIARLMAILRRKT